MRYRFVRFSGGPLAGETHKADPRDSLRWSIGCPTLNPSGEYIPVVAAGVIRDFAWRPKAGA